MVFPRLAQLLSFKLRGAGSGLMLLALASGALVLPAQPGGSTFIDSQLGAPLTVRPRPTLGQNDSPVVIIEVRSFKCAHCRAFHDRIFPRLRELYIAPGQVRWVTVNASPDATDESAAVYAISRAAQQMGKYAELEGFLFENALRPSSLLISRAAAHPAIDADELQRLLREPETSRAVAADFAELRALNVKVLPTFILRKRQPDGRMVETRIEGYPELGYFQRVLEQLRAQ